MGGETTAQKVDPGLVARIVQRYVTKNTVAVDQLTSLITTVHSALRGISTATPPVTKVLTPAVPIRRSVQRDHVVCLECGFRGLTQLAQNRGGFEGGADRRRGASMAWVMARGDLGV